MAVAYASTQTSGATSGTSKSVTKPTSLAVGDLLVGCIIGQNLDADTGTSLPTGFSGYATVTVPGNSANMKVCYKIATSDDVSESTFSWGHNGRTLTSQASMTRITGATTNTSVYQSNVGTQSNTATPSIAAGVTPDARGNTLLLQFWGGNTAATNVTTYAIATSNPSWTEAFELNDSGPAVNLSLAYAIRPEATATGNVSCAGGDASSDWGVRLISIPGPLDATVTESVTMTEVSLQNMSELTNESVTTTEVSDVDASLPWTNQSKSSTTWTNQNKS